MGNGSDALEAVERLAKRIDELEGLVDLLSAEIDDLKGGLLDGKVGE
jgi:archaellum component FlaC